MTTNVTITTFDFAALVVFQDNSHVVVDANSSGSWQLVDKGFCTISEVADPDAGEHPPEPPTSPGFIQRMIEFWQAYKPTATPL